jgi:hypothetical protein
MKRNNRSLAAVIGLVLFAPAAARADGYTFAYAFGEECG